jgi:hypothetical protein
MITSTETHSTGRLALLLLLLLLLLFLLLFPPLLLLLSFGILQLMLPEAPQPYGLMYYHLIGHSNFLHQFCAATPPPKQRKLEL